MVTEGELIVVGDVDVPVTSRPTSRTRCSAAATTGAA